MVSPIATVTGVPPVADQVAVPAGRTGSVARGRIEPVTIEVSGWERLACWPTGASARDWTRPVGTAGTGGVASALLWPPKGLEKGFSEKRIASELHALAAMPTSVTKARRKLTRDKIRGPQ